MVGKEVDKVVAKVVSKEEDKVVDHEVDKDGTHIKYLKKRTSSSLMEML